MSERLHDVWLPAVEAEFFSLLRLSRDVGVDVGKQFRDFEHVLEHGLDPIMRPIDRVGSADVYVVYARHVAMYFAVSGSRAAIVKWATLRTPHEGALARAEAQVRAAQLFP